MRHLILYVFESSVCLALFMVFYKLLLQRDTRHGRNRFFLLFSLFASVVIPLLNFDTTLSGNSGLIRDLSEVSLPEVKILASSNKSGDNLGINISLLIYISGLALAFISFVISLSGVLLLILTSPAENRIIKLSSHKPTCFSAFGFVFISIYVPPVDAERMIAHELNHIRKNHFVDLLLVTFVGIFQWFNPAVYFLRRSLQAVHEFEADEECLNKGEDIISYQSLLVSSAFSTNIPILTNKFSNKSLLKKRIIMMTKKKTGSFSSMKMLLALPLAALMFFAFSCNRNGNKAPTSAEFKSAVTASGDEVFVVCEQMPSFPGGDEALLKFISENVKYPEAAKNNGIHGTVIMRFCITKEGKTDKITVARGVDPSLDQEAIRVVKSLPAFEPGKQGGKNVDVWFSLPVSFVLN
jgi:TonB family protein